MNAAERRNLLEELGQLAHREAENVEHLPRKFLPLASHRLALRPEIVVVRGGRGAGKSALFGLLKNLSSSDLGRFFADDRLPRATWVDTFSQVGARHPEVGVLDRFAADASGEELRAFWTVHLLRRITNELSECAVGASEVQELLRRNAGDPKAWIRDAMERLGAVSLALDSVERILEREERTVFATYDHLDRIGAFNPTIRARYVSALLASWLSLSNRYKRIRAKIFLREDLFDAGEMAFPDASKLRPRSVSIDWNVEALYRVVVRHLSNGSEPMRRWLRDCPGLELQDRGEFGWMPREMPEKVQKAFADRLAGELMGKGLKKGYTYRWIPNRLQDARGEVVPRSILSLLGFAAENAARNPLTKGKRLITPPNLGEALEATSKARAKEIGEEYELVNRLENFRGQHVMLDPQLARDLLEQPVPGESDGLSTKGDLALDELERLGVLSVRTDGRIDVPDIYRYGFGILRKGGVARPR